MSLSLVSGNNVSNRLIDFSFSCQNKVRNCHCSECSLFLKFKTQPENEDASTYLGEHVPHAYITTTIFDRINKRKVLHNQFSSPKNSEHLYRHTLHIIIVEFCHDRTLPECLLFSLRIKITWAFTYRTHTYTFLRCKIISKFRDININQNWYWVV